MRDPTSSLDHDQNLRAAVVDAERIITETWGTNLDPIIQALDERLFGPDGKLSTTPPPWGEGVVPVRRPDGINPSHTVRFERWLMTFPWVAAREAPTRGRICRYRSVRAVLACLAGPA